MGRTPCCSKLEDLNRGAWTADEDRILTNYIRVHGENGWRSLPKKAGLKRCGKSCRLRWLNYLRPEIKRGNITPDEEELIIRMHRLLGNRWALIAGRLPGRTDNEIKNYWNTHLSKKIAMSSSDALNSTSHLPLRKSISFSGMEEDSPRSQNSNEDDGDKPWEIRWASDNDISSGVLAGMHASVGGEQDASRSWAQLLEESLMADDDAQVDEKNIISSSELNVSDPLEYFYPFTLPFIDFGMLEDFSMERLLQPEPYGFEDMHPLDNTHNNVDYAHCLSMEAEQGIADTSEQREVCSEQEREVGFDPLDYLSYHEEKWEDQVDLCCHIKSNEEEYLDILVDTPNKTGLG